MTFKIKYGGGDVTVVFDTRRRLHCWNIICMQVLHSFLHNIWLIINFKSWTSLRIFSLWEIVVQGSFLFTSFVFISFSSSMWTIENWTNCNHVRILIEKSAFFSTKDNYEIATHGRTSETKVLSCHIQMMKII